MQFIVLIGKKWLLRFVYNLSGHGDCDPPWRRGKQIRISNKLRGKDLLETIIHECTHGSFWMLDESYVTEFSHDLTKIITSKEVWERITEGEILDNNI
jgi:hypothetical protein